MFFIGKIPYSDPETFTDPAVREGVGGAGGMQALNRAAIGLPGSNALLSQRLSS